MRILPTITTITPGAWREKIKEVQKLKLKEIALFPTCLNQAERKALYQLLKETNIKSIPLVHLRSDMEEGELAYLIKNYQTKVFNTHTWREYSISANWAKYQNLIYIENTHQRLDEEEIKKFAGVCLDFSHLENDRLLHQDIYEHDIKLIQRYPLGCGHISAIKTAPVSDRKSKLGYDSHDFENLSEFEYLKRYPLKYFPELIAVELENSLEDQLKAKEYIIKLLNIKK